MNKRSFQSVMSVLADRWPFPDADARTDYANRLWMRIESWKRDGSAALKEAVEALVGEKLRGSARPSVNDVVSKAKDRLDAERPKVDPVEEAKLNAIREVVHAVERGDLKGDTDADMLRAALPRHRLEDLKSAWKLVMRWRNCHECGYGIALRRGIKVDPNPYIDTESVAHFTTVGAYYFCPDCRRTGLDAKHDHAPVDLDSELTEADAW